MTRVAVGRALVAGAVMLSSLSLSAAPADAAPANDAFGAATVLTPNTVVHGDTTGATREAGEPSTSCAVEPDEKGTVWYRFMVPSGVAEIEVEAEDWDSFALAIYRGDAIGALEPVACADESRTESWSVERLTVGSYALAVQGSWGTNDGPFTLDFGFAPDNASRPAHDERRGAITLPQGSTIVAGDTTGSKTNHSDPAPSCIGSAPMASVWYGIDPRVDGTLFLRAAGEVDHALAVFEGDRHAVTEVGCADGWAGGEREHLEVELNGGRPYLVAVAGATTADRGPFVLHSSFVVAPPNDDFADAQAITLPASVTGDTLAATREAGEPTDCSPSQGSVWYSFTSPTTGQARMIARSTSSPPAATYPLSACTYRGTSLDALSFVAKSDHLSRTFAVVAGDPYRIALAEGYFPGPSLLDIEFVQAPVNDEPGAATALMPGGFTGTTAGATRSATEPPLSCSQYTQSTVWYSYTATSPGSFVLDMTPTTGAYGAALYRLDGSTFTPVTCTLSSGGRVTINERVEPGGYVLAVLGHPFPSSGFAGTFAYVPGA